MAYSLVGKRIWVAGHKGMVGGAVVRRLGDEGCEIITAGRDLVDLTKQNDVHDWMRRENPDAIIFSNQVISPDSHTSRNSEILSLIFLRYLLTEICFSAREKGV